MRQKHQKQLNLESDWLDFDHSKELQVISDLLDENPKVVELVWQDLEHAKLASSSRRGADGLSADQVLRALIIKQLRQFSYRDLAFHIADSNTYRKFCRIGWSKPPSKSTLAECIKALRSETLERINRIIVGYAMDRKIERGEKSRADTTVVETNIHHPLDSSLLNDCVRTLTRCLRKGRKLGLEYAFPDRTRRARRRSLAILNARRKEKRKPLYRDLIRVVEEVVVLAEGAVAAIDRAPSSGDIIGDAALAAVREELLHYIPLARKVVGQTRRRVLFGETLPPSEKIVSIFEEHTDIIRKDHRDTYYGHKVCLTSGGSGLITDCQVLDGNPADSTLAEQVVDRQIEILGKVPRQMAYDGGFTSRANLEAIKDKGVQDVAFSKARNIEISDMVKSTWIYKRLRAFRAGIEATISFLKRVFGLDRCMWRSLKSFKSYVWSSVLTFNLLLIARHQLS
jgi:transposase, IS5 family